MTDLTALASARRAASRHLPTLFKFALVGATGLVVNTGALLALTEWAQVHYLAGVILATQISTAWNFALTETAVFNSLPSGRWRRLLGFAAVNNGALLVRGPMIVFLTETMGIHYAIGNVISLIVVLFVRYGISAGFLWRDAPVRPTGGADPAAPTLFKRLQETVVVPTVDKLSEAAAVGRRLLLPRKRIWWWRNPLATLVAIGGTSLVLRFWSIGALGLNSDEAVYTGQGASLAGLEPFNHHFSVFRAHPLLFQYIVAAVSRVHFWDTVGRWIAAVFGLATIWVTFKIGEELISRRAGWIAAGLLAVMPYHVVVSRQALLETPMAFFMGLTMLALIKYHRNPSWIGALGIGAAAGLAFLAKETAIIVLLSVGIFIALRGGWNTRHIFAGFVVFGLAVSPHLYATVVGKAAEGDGGSGWANYVLWQLSRPPNHPESFYLTNMAHYFGVPMLVLVIAGTVWLIRREGRKSDRAALLLAWAGVPLLIFQLWPVKGYHYLIPIAPAAAIIAVVGGAAIGTWLKSTRMSPRLRTHLNEWLLGLAFIGAIVVAATNGPILLNHDRIGDAGYSGLPGVRELTHYIDNEVPEGARFLGIGPSITNVIAFYSDRETLALSVSPNPLRRNPAYDVVRNADYDVRWGLYEYLIYDAYSAERTSHFANRLLDLADRYSSTVVYEDLGTFVADDGEPFTAPVFRIYRVAPIASTQEKTSE